MHQNITLCLGILVNFQPEGIDKIENLNEDDEFACGKQKIAKSCKKKKIVMIWYQIKKIKEESVLSVDRQFLESSVMSGCHGVVGSSACNSCKR